MDDGFKNFKLKKRMKRTGENRLRAKTKRFCFTTTIVG